MFLAVGTDLCFKAAVEADDEWIVGESQNVPFSKHLLHLVAKYKVVFQEFFHRKNLPQLLVPYQVHSSTSHMQTVLSVMI